MQPATDSTTALKNLQTYQQQLQTPEAAAQAANKALGVDQAQQQVQGLRGAIQRTTGLLQQISPSVYGRTQNSLVTQAQAGRQIANEQAPVQQDLQNLGTQYSGANQDYQNLQGQANQQAANTLSEQQGQTSYLQSLYQALLGNEQSAKDEAYRQSQLAEQRRQFDASLANSKVARAASNGASYATPTLNNGQSSSVGTISRDSAGGYAIKGPNGNAITFGQYAAMNGLGIDWISQQLMQSGSPNDQKIAADINSRKYTPDQLRRMYPQALGGSY